MCWTWVSYMTSSDQSMFYCGFHIHNLPCSCARISFHSHPELCYIINTMHFFSINHQYFSHMDLVIVTLQLYTSIYSQKIWNLPNTEMHCVQVMQAKLAQFAPLLHWQQRCPPNKAQVYSHTVLCVCHQRRAFPQRLVQAQSHHHRACWSGNPLHPGQMGRSPPGVLQPPPQLRAPGSSEYRDRAQGHLAPSPQLLGKGWRWDPVRSAGRAIWRCWTLKKARDLTTSLSTVSDFWSSFGVLNICSYHWGWYSKTKGKAPCMLLASALWAALDLTEEKNVRMKKEWFSSEIFTVQLFGP